jgi:GTP diphosphokinase / guanosine-3',5'-bis(diphosphate) 3'-diphosphatase
MQQLFEKAILIALNAHKDQVDKGGNPYILHPLRVMLAMDTLEAKIVALLHDVVEDSTTTIHNLKEDGFPESIQKAVSILTKKESQSYQDYILLVHQNPLATKIKLADLKDNMDESRLKEITDADKLRIKKYETAYELLTATN